MSPDTPLDTKYFYFQTILIFVEAVKSTCWNNSYWRNVLIVVVGNPPSTMFSLKFLTNLCYIASFLFWFANKKVVQTEVKYRFYFIS